MLGLSCPHCGEENQFQLETEYYYEQTVFEICEHCRKPFSFSWEIVVQDPKVCTMEEYKAQIPPEPIITEIEFVSHKHKFALQNSPGEKARFTIELQDGEFWHWKKDNFLLAYKPSHREFKNQCIRYCLDPTWREENFIELI